MSETEHLTSPSIRELAAAFSVRLMYVTLISNPSAKLGDYGKFPPLGEACVQRWAAMADKRRILVVIHSLMKKKQQGATTTENAGDSEPESLIPLRSWTTDAMSELPLEPLVPPLAIVAFIACVAGAAALADCAIFALLLKRRLKTGLFSIIIQLTIADILLLGTTAGPELWSLNLRKWQFGTAGCEAYQGLNVFTTTLSTYLLIAITLHTLTTISLEERAAERRVKRNDKDEMEEIRSSQHSLVANSDSSTPPRTMIVDYRMADTRVPVTWPTFFVWVLAMSLSVPEYALAAVVHRGKNDSTCTLDSIHQFNVYSMLAIFNLFLPLFLISISSAFVIIKLNNKKSVVPGSVLDCSDSKPALKLSLCLMCVHILLCTPRSVVSVYRIYSGRELALDFYFYNDMAAIINLALSSANLTAALIRPLLCILILPQLRYFFTFNPRISEV